MAKKVKFGWLKDKGGERFAPKTLISQVINKNGKSLEKILEELPQNGGGGNGRPGNDGFSPKAKVEETAEGAKITITDKEGTTTAIVKHGKNGKNGSSGKTAYQYAKDGGYTGTEEEFAQKLAQENPTKEEFVKLSEDIEELKQSGTSSGLNSTEKTLILSLFKNAAYTADMSATIAKLEVLWSSGTVEPGEPTVPDTPDAEVSQNGSVLSIVSGVTVNQNGSVLNIS